MPTTPLPAAPREVMMSDEYNGTAYLVVVVKEDAEAYYGYLPDYRAAWERTDSPIPLVKYLKQWHAPVAAQGVKS